MGNISDSHINCSHTHMHTQAEVHSWQQQQAGNKVRGTWEENACRAEISDYNDRPIKLILHWQPDVSPEGFTHSTHSVRDHNLL